MTRILVLFLAVFATASLNLPANAQTTTGQSVANTPPQMSSPPQPILSHSQRAEIARDLVAKWQSAADRRPSGGERWRQIVTEAVIAADEQNLLRAVAARSIEELHIALNLSGTARPASSAIQGNGKVAPELFGSFARDLVYTPLPLGRCRIADSRNINSPLVGTRHLKVDNQSSYAAQGGTGTYTNGGGAEVCGIPPNAKAYAMSVTLLSSTAAGIFKVFEAGRAFQTGNSVTMTPGPLSGSADLIVTSCLGCINQLSIYSPNSVHYVIDIVGFFMPPEQTSLSCYRTAPVVSGLGHGSSGNFFAPACQSDYTRVSVECFADRVPVTLTSWGGECLAYNFSGATSNISRASVCCSIPGR
jgi:hypothetical protein